MDWVLQIFSPATISNFFTQFHAEMQQPAFWVALGKIMWINILLSGDNALVIAMACRGLPPRQRFWGMILGAGVAVLLRIIFTVIVVTLMGLPFLKLVGGLALLYIAAKLLVPEHEGEGGVDSAAHLWAAVRIVAIADIVMSLDNVIAVAAAANGSIPLLVIGLAISVPLIVAGAALIMALLTRLPVGVGRRRLAGLDRRRGDGDRPSSCRTAAVLQRPGRRQARRIFARSACPHLPMAAMAARWCSASSASSSCWWRGPSGASARYRNLRRTSAEAAIERSLGNSESSAGRSSRSGRAAAPVA